MATATCVWILFVASSLSTIAQGDHVPVLIWSPDRPLRDLPQAPAMGSVSQQAFHDNYLTPLLSTQAPVIVAFLQDKLHLNDISKYADVYNPDSDGGAFKNIKGYMDEHFSLELPQVTGSHLALSALQKHFPGTVHDLSATSDLSDLDLSGQGSHLVIVRLLPVAHDQSEEAAIAVNDELIGKVSQYLEKRQVKFTAFYTAETSQQREKRETHLTRHLLEAPDLDKRGAFYNVSYVNGTMYAYLTNVSACIMQSTKPDESTPKFCPVNFTANADDLGDSDMTVNLGPNNTLVVVLSVNNIPSNFSSDVFNLSFMFSVEHQKDRWEILQGQVTITNVSDSSNETLVNEVDMVTRDYDLVMSLLYSFHCSSMRWYPKNMSEPSLPYVVLTGFQIQPFNVTPSGFLLPQDCQGWFTTGIWMALFVIGLHILILFFGMYMIISLSANDRFDDPKGKGLTIQDGD